jgi:uncharacterized protein YcgL (UPF0745 family)
MLCEVFRSPRREGMYLYIDKQQGLESLPEALLASFGQPESVMTLVLTPQRRLARADAAAVLAAIAECGYYLQMPPSSLSHNEQ